MNVPQPLSAQLANASIQVPGALVTRLTWWLNNSLASLHEGPYRYLGFHLIAAQSPCGDTSCFFLPFPCRRPLDNGIPGAANRRGMFSGEDVQT